MFRFLHQYLDLRYFYILKEYDTLIVQGVTVRQNFRGDRLYISDRIAYHVLDQTKKRN